MKLIGKKDSCKQKSNNNENKIDKQTNICRYIYNWNLKLVVIEHKKEKAESKAEEREEKKNCLIKKKLID